MVTEQEEVHVLGSGPGQALPRELGASSFSGAFRPDPEHKVLPVADPGGPSLAATEPSLRKSGSPVTGDTRQAAGGKQGSQPSIHHM